MSRARAPECIESDDLMEFTLEGVPDRAAGRKPYAERFIHGAIYEARPDVHAVVHNHSPSVIPFGITGTPLRPVMHMCASMGTQVPTWDSRTNFGDTNLLVTNMEMARDLAAALGDRPVALMRGHGCVVAGPSLRDVVFNAVYLELNAELQMKASIAGDHHVPQRRRGRGRAQHAQLVHLRARLGVLVPEGRASVRCQARWRARSLVDTEVLIVGAGPVGLTLAIDLGTTRGALHARREKGGAGIPAEDGAVQRPDDGDLPPDGGGGERIRDGRVAARTFPWTSTSRWP